MALAQEIENASTSCVEGVTFTIFFDMTTFPETIALCEARGMEIAAVRSIAQFKHVETMSANNRRSSYAWLGIRMSIRN
ncbi:MAG: hypothetical protein MI921_12010 [Cytophagales bacterium]|nr:hypothetical protein [Cytophagales bacterium]